MPVREVGGYEQLQRPMHGVEVVALVPQLSAVAIREGHVDLSEQDLAQCCAKLFWHVWSVRKLIDAKLASRLSSARSLSRQTHHEHFHRPVSARIHGGEIFLGQHRYLRLCGARGRCQWRGLRAIRDAAYHGLL